MLSFLFMQGVSAISAQEPSVESFYPNIPESRYAVSRELLLEEIQPRKDKKKLGAIAGLVGDIPVRGGPVVAAAGLEARYRRDPNTGRLLSVHLSNSLLGVVEEVRAGLFFDPLKVIGKNQVVDFSSGLHREAYFKGNPLLETDEGLIQNLENVITSLEPFQVQEATDDIASILDNPERLREMIQNYAEQTEDAEVSWRELTDDEKKTRLDEVMADPRLSEWIRSARPQMIENQARARAEMVFLQKVFESFPSIPYEVTESGEMKTYLPIKQYLDFLGRVYPYSQIDPENPNAVVGSAIDLFYSSEEVSRVATALAEREGRFVLQTKLDIKIAEHPETQELVIDVATELVGIELNKDGSLKGVLPPDQMPNVGVDLVKKMPQPMVLNELAIVGAMKELKLLSNSEGEVTLGGAILMGGILNNRTKFNQQAMQKLLTTAYKKGKQLDEEFSVERSLENGVVVLRPSPESRIVLGDTELGAFIASLETPNTQILTSSSIHPNHCPEPDPLADIFEGVR